MRNLICFTALVALLSFVALPVFAQDEDAEPVSKYVELALRGPFVDTKPAFSFSPRAQTLRSVIDQLDRMQHDEQVIGVVLKIESLNTGWAMLQELRDKIVQLREAKPVIAYLEDADNAEYLLACAAERIVLMPEGFVGLTGLRAEVMFYKGLLDKLDIEADMYAVGQYKSAIEPFTQDSMSDAQRESVNAILDDLYMQQAQAIATGREKLDVAATKALIDQGPFTAQESLEAGLVDALQYYDELLATLEDEQDSTVEFVSDYGRRKPQAQEFTGFAGFMKLFSMLTTANRPPSRVGKPKIALIYANGAIMPNMPTDPFSTGQIITPNDVAKAIREAREDASLRAVVLRVNSPGGSALASDIIWREVMLTQREKPVVVSMSDVAASGGYYIAMAAGTIVAEPGTITGSIGVFGGKLNLRGLYHKVGLTKEVITRGQNANLYSDYHTFTPSERERLEKMLSTIYETFVEKAAEGRRKPTEAIHEVAQGRIWTGQQAKALGLVDELGGLDTALTIAKKQVALAPDAEINLIVLPKPKTFIEMLMEDMEMEAGVRITPDISIPLSLAGALPGLHWIRLFANETIATAMPFDIRIR